MILIRISCYMGFLIHLKSHFSVQIQSEVSKNTPEFGQFVFAFCASHVILTLSITVP